MTVLRVCDCSDFSVETPAAGLKCWFGTFSFPCRLLSISGGQTGGPEMLYKCTCSDYSRSFSHLFTAN